MSKGRHRTSITEPTRVTERFEFPTAEDRVHDLDGTTHRCSFIELERLRDEGVDP